MSKTRFKQLQIFLDKSPQALHPWIWVVSLIFLLDSLNVLRDWTVPCVWSVCEIPYSGLSTVLMRFKAGLWLGHWMTVIDLFQSHSSLVWAVHFGSLSGWKVKCHPSVRCHAGWGRVSSKTSLYVTPFPF